MGTVRDNMVKINKIVVIPTLALAAYASNFAYHTDQALKSTNELARVNEILEMNRGEFSKLGDEARRTRVTITDDPKIQTEKYSQGGWNYHVVRHGERNWQDEIWDKQKKLLGEEVAYMIKQDNFKSDLKTHLTKRWRVF